MSNTQVSKRYANFVRVGSDGNVGWYDPKGNLIFVGYKQPTSGGVINQNNPVIGFGGTSGNLIGGINGSFGFADNDNTNFMFSVQNESSLAAFSGAGLTMNGLPIISGHPDLRIGVTAADAAAITIFSSTAAGTRYEIKARILATVGTSAVYTITWTEGGAARTVALTVSAVGTEYHDNFVVAPDSGTNITAQITSLTTSTVNVDAIVSVLG